MRDPQVFHEIVQELRRLASELGRAPRREDLDDSRFSRRSVDAVFGTFTEALRAAGLDAKSQKKQKKFKYLPKKLESIVIHEYDLKALFEWLKNPPVIKMVFQPDTHMKHADERALGAYLEFIHDYRPHIDVIGGDLMDAEGISHWPTESLEPRRQIHEVMKTREFLHYKTSLTPDCAKRFFLCGNHEDWIRQYLLRVPELMDGLELLGMEINVRSLLDLDKYGYELIPMNEFLKIGKAHFTHGIYTGDNHARKHLQKLKDNVYYGHLHDTGSAADSSINGTIHAQSLACLCRLDAPFLKGRINNWQHGLGIFEFFPDGSYTMTCPTMKDGKFSYGGKVYGKT